MAVENSVSYVLDNTASIATFTDNFGNPVTMGFARVPDLVGRWDRAFDWAAISVRGESHVHRLNDGASVSLPKRGFGRRTTLAGENGDMSRINFSAKYNFS